MSITGSSHRQTGLLQQQNSNNSRLTWLSLILVLIGIGGYLYLNLFLLPSAPILLSGDQVYFWMDGQRMLNGERPYQDFFQFTPPGADIFYLAVFKVFGPRIWALNLVVLLLGVGLCLVCLLIADQIMSPHLALLSALLFATLIYTRLLNATHHYFSVLAVMSATAFLMRRVSPFRLAIAGVLLGIASFFTQTHGFVGLLAITLLLCWERYQANSWHGLWRTEGVLLLGYAVALLVLYAPFIVSVGLKKLWYFQIYYVWKAMVHRPETRLLGMPEPLDWRREPLLSAIAEYGRHLFVYAMLPTTYLVVLMRCRGRQLASDPYFRKIALLGLVGSALLGELIFSLNWLRLYTVSMAGIILFVWAIGTMTKLRRCALALIWMMVVCLGLFQPWLIQRQTYVVADLPAGRSAVEPGEFEKLDWGMHHTTAGEFFFQASWPGVYIPLGLRNPVFLDTAGTMLNSQWAEEAVQQLDAKRVQYIVWTGRLNYPADPHHPRTANIVPLRAYIHSRYELTKVFGDGDEVWERR